jgi:hypothetical protein
MSGEMITKPDANPILLAVLDIVICSLPIGHFMIGQTKKAIIFYVAFIVLFPVGGLGGFVPLIAAYDAYLLGQKLARGESIGVNENGLAFLNSVPGFN